ncbi:hypothetical protein HTVC106P_gp32 [Pelagibacter phage HTVC106P]|jgi:hypothetical protein|nr:hypothetical protein HTVC106P_gp32 [Pelagibacter phage HTVC106P]|tara:strand:+ start:395 stop:586 length:192 start_codon:yes stop_codon:yes gene_type:complete
MFCVIWKKNDSNKYEMFTNLLFENEKKAVEFRDKQTQFRKKHDARAVEFDYKYFKGVNENEIK